MRRKPEKPQKGNPHRLRVNQHVWPRRSIERFVDAAGKVTLFDRSRNKVRKAAPNDDIFRVKRVWDQRAEAGFMKSIEDDFQSLADEIIAGKVNSLDQKQKLTADAFYALWRARADHRVAGDDHRLKGVIPPQWTKDQQEEFEKHGMWFVREDGMMPDRFLRGFLIQRDIDVIVDDLARAQWGILRANQGNLIVPDHPGATPIIPLTPTLCLCWGQATANVGWRHVAVINRYFNAVSHHHLFGRDLSQCPLNPQADTPAVWQAP